MTSLEIIVLAVALALDSMLVSFSYGLIINQRRLYNSMLLSLAFGFFQFLMPIIGFYLTGLFYTKLQVYSKWIVFVIFMILGLKFLKEALEKSEEKNEIQCISFFCILCLAIATSIDALGAGVSLKLLNVNYIIASIVIGVITFVFSTFGFWMTKLFSRLPAKYIGITGSFLLIYLAIKAIL